MWFKGLLFLSYTALLVAPTNAASRGQDVRVSNRQIQVLDARHRGNPHDQAAKDTTSPPPHSSEVTIFTSTDVAPTSTQVPKAGKGGGKGGKHNQPKPSQNKPSHTEPSTTGPPPKETPPTVTPPKETPPTITPPSVTPGTEIETSTIPSVENPSKHHDNSTIPSTVDKESSNKDSETSTCTTECTTDLPTTLPGNVPVSETLDTFTRDPKTTEHVPTQSGITFPGGAGTNPLPKPTVTITSTPSIKTDTNTPPTETDTDIPPIETDTDIPPIETDTDTLPIETDTNTSPTEKETLPTSTVVTKTDPTRPVTTEFPIMISTSLGISFPGAPGTGVFPSITDTTTSVPSNVVPTLTIPAEVAPTTDVATDSSTELPPEFLPTNLLPSNGTAAPTTGTPDTSNLVTSPSTGIPTSESLPTSLPAILPTGPGRNSSAQPTPSPYSPGSIQTGGSSALTRPDKSAIFGPSNGLNSNNITRTTDLNGLLSSLRTTGGYLAPTGASDSSAKASGSSEDNTGNSGASTFSTGYTSPGPSPTTLTGYVDTRTSSGPAATKTQPPAGAAPPPPPLTKSQTAGIVVGGTTCLIIALVAALFVARRYHQKASRRRSTGSIYPEVAYLYDPPVPGTDHDDSGAGGALMSGGATGYDAIPRISPAGSPHQRPASAPQNPFRDPEANMPQNPFRDPIIPSPHSSPRLTGYGGPLGDSKGQYAKLAAIPYTFNPAVTDYPPMSPYDHHQDHTFPLVARGPSNSSSEPFSEPLEHDLLLNVDSQTETPDSIIVLAPPPTPRARPFTERYTPDLAQSSQTSLLLPASRYTPSPDNSSNTTFQGRYSPESSSLAPSTNTQLTYSPHLTPPRRTASPPAIHKGWDDIKLDDAVLIPAPLSVSAAINRKPVAQRQERALAGAGQLLLAGHGLPLTVKKIDITSPQSNSKEAGLGLEVPSLSTMYGSQVSTSHEFNRDPKVLNKRSSELLFADPHLIGREF